MSTAMRPTIYRLGEDGVPVGRPAIEADMLQAWRLPDMQRLRDYMTRAGQTRNYWAKVGGKGAILNKAYLGIANTWSAIADFWKMGTLGTRLFGALPLRIASEEMLRMAAYDYASAVWHPAEWFASTRAGARFADADVRLVFDSPIHALGAAVQDMSTRSPYYLARTGRHVVGIGDEANFPGVFYRAVTNRLNAMHNSYTSRTLLKYMGDPKAAVAEMRKTEMGREMLAHWTKGDVFDEVTAASRVETEMRQLIGTGPGAEIVEQALRRGSIKVDDAFRISDEGEVYTLGTQEFADLLKRMSDEGVWTPPRTQVAVSAGDYLPIESRVSLRDAANVLFRYGYAAPDLALARSPLFRQMAKRNFRNYVARGYSPEVALKIARAEAARGVSDIMFTIGSKTSGEWMVRNFMPFFPAYRELATTWVKRIPLRIGEGHYFLGAATLARRADYWMQFFKDIGVIDTNTEGKPTVGLPFLGDMLKVITGQDVEFRADAPLESFVGVLPLPIGLFGDDDKDVPWHMRLRGAMPTLGGPASMLLGGINNILKGKLDTAEDWLTMYGTDQSLMPFTIERMLGALGIDPWFASATTRDMSQAMRYWATIDGMRLAAQELPYPKMEDFDSNDDGDLSPDEQAALGAAVKTWREELVGRGESYQSRLYFWKAINSMVLPFSVRYTDELKAETSALWSLLNTLPEGVSDEAVRSAFIDSFLAANPELGPYMTGKSQDTRLVDDPDERFDEYMEAIKSGAVQVRTPEEWAIFSLGMNSYSIYQSRLDAIYSEAGDTPGERLLNFDAKEAAAEARDAWEDFLDYTSTLTTDLGDTQSFADMFEQYQNYIAARDGENPRLSIEEQQFLEFDRSMRDMSEFFSPNPENSADYYKMRDRIYEKLEGMGNTSEMSQATNWWYDRIQGPYYDQRQALYDKVNALPFDDPQRGLIYNQIRELSDQYSEGIRNPDHPEWGEFPSPEAYSFAKLDPAAQRRQTVHWASLPPEYLTQFQRETVGYDVPENKQDEANQLATIMARREVAFDEWAIKTGHSPGSLAYEDERKKVDRLIAEKAKDLGLEDYYAGMQAPMFERVGLALGLSEESPLWEKVSRWADNLRNQITSYGNYDYSTGGTSDIAEWAHGVLNDQVSQWRRNNKDFDRIMSEVAMALGENGNPLPDYDLVRVLFFDKYIP